MPSQKTSRKVSALLSVSLLIASTLNGPIAIAQSSDSNSSSSSAAGAAASPSTPAASGGDTATTQKDKPDLSVLDSFDDTGSQAGEKKPAAQPAKQETPVTTTPPAASQENQSVEQKQTTAEVSTAGVPQPHKVGQPAEKPPATQKPPAKPRMLFGRIEEIAGSANANLPIVFKAMKPMLDTRKVTPLKGQTSEYSGVVTQSFPEDYRGNWGGTLQVVKMQQDPRCWQIDSAEANKLQQILIPNLQGSTNFIFNTDRFGKIAVEPAKVMFMVPAKDTNTGDELNKMLGGMGAMGGMGQMMGQMMQNMNVPILLTFGEIKGGDAVTGVSGNKLDADLLKNTIRELAPGVFEQQIVSRLQTIMKGTNSMRYSFDESVIRFQKQANRPDLLWVTCASVTYDKDGKFLRKMILRGWMQKGRTMQNDPMQAMTGGLGGLGGAAGAGGLGGLGGLGALEGLLKGQPGGGGMPNLQNLQNLPGLGGQGAGGLQQQLEQMFNNH